MRRITYWALSTLTVLVLLFSYSTSRGNTIAAASAETRTTGTTSSSTSTPTPSPTDLPSTSATTTTPQATTATTDATTQAGTAASSTYTGDEVDTRWGIVQVQITVADGKIVTSKVVQVPWDNPRDQQINSRAVPVYNSDAVAAQSADIDVISGATVTWQGYTQSLQSAIDQAGL